MFISNMNYSNRPKRNETITMKNKHFQIGRISHILGKMETIRETIKIKQANVKNNQHTRHRT